MSFTRGNLFTRLLILVAAASAPAIAVHAYLRSDLSAVEDRFAQQSARYVAELFNAEIGAIVEGARQMSLAISQEAAVLRLDSGCAPAMVAISQAMPRYALLRVVDEDGAVLCSSSPQSPSHVSSLQRRQNEAASAKGSFQTGLMMQGEAGNGPVVAFSQPFTGAAQRRGVINIGISLAWLNEHFASIARSPGQSVLIADRNGTIVVATPMNASMLGARMPSDMMALLDAPQSGTLQRVDEAGSTHPFGYVPISHSPGGLFVGITLPPPGSSLALESRDTWSLAMMVLGAVLSFGLALLAGQMFVRRPTNALLEAARRWSQGDLEVRVAVPRGKNSEFGRLAMAFNEMAAALSRQKAETAELLDTLEARVSARTQDLLISRDRLQVALGQQARSEASLNQMQKLQAVGQLAGGVAHDFNNLLTSVIGALEILRGRLAPDDERSLRLLDGALHAADRGGRLTSQLLSFSRRQHLVPVPTDLNIVLLGMVSLLTTTLGRNIRVETGLAPTLWLALADPHQVESAVLNMALNARDAMPNGGTLRIATVNITVQQASGGGVDRPAMAATDGSLITQEAAPGDYVMIRMSDTGAGMPPDVLARVFEPFFTTKKQGRGAGLGLSQVHGLAAQSGGEVRISSEPGLGTTVSLLLPRAVTTTASSSPTSTALPPPAKSLRVMLVDDDADVRALTGEMLRELGHRPLIFADGAAALGALDGGIAADLLLTDFAMPGINGRELIERIAALHPAIPAILMTGHADVDLSNFAKGRVLRKPFVMSALARVLEEFSAPVREG